MEWRAPLAAAEQPTAPQTQLPTVRTVNDIFFHVVGRDRPRVVCYRSEDGQWVYLSARQLYSRVISTARALEEWGIKPGDRIALMSENRPEWAIVDFATLLLGAANVPIYPTLTAEQSAYILKDSGARLAFVSSRDQLEKLQKVQHDTHVEKIVVMDDVEAPGVVRMSDFCSDAVTQREAHLEAKGRAVTPQDLATLIYTSGTTGTPKGVMLTHDNLASNMVSLEEYDWSEADTCISFLPLSHITARHLDYVCFTYGAMIAYCPNFERLPQTMQEVRPTLFVGVPRVYEKIRSGVEARIGGGVKRKVYDWARKVGKRYRNEILAGRRPETTAWKLADRLVYSKVLAAFGGRTRNWISGGAPLGVRLSEWFADMGIRIYEGYGLTETSPVIAINTPEEHRIGSVGKPLPNVEVKIA